MNIKKTALAAIALLCVSTAAFSTNHFWAIAPPVSVYDSLKLAAQKNDVPYEAFRKYSAAIDFRSELLKYEIKLPTPPVSAGIYDVTGTDSLSAYDQLLFLYRQLGDLKAETEVLNAVGIQYAVDGDFDRSISSLRQSLDISLHTNDKNSTMRAYATLGRIYAYRGQLTDATNSFQQVATLAAQLKNNTELSVSYFNLAKIWASQGRFKDAENMLMKQALPLVYYRMKDKRSVIRCFEQLGNLYFAQKRYSEAKWFHIQSNTVARSIADSQAIVNSLINIAHVKMSIGHNDLALRDIKEAEKVASTHKYNFKLAEIKNDLGQVYTRLGNITAANSAFSEYTTLRQLLMAPTSKTL